MQVWGIRSHFTTPYHPESNGLVERFHRRLKESLNALAANEPERWYWRLPCSLLAIRTTLKPDVGASPADLVFGEGLAVPGELIGSSRLSEDTARRQRERTLDQLRLEVARIQPTPTSAHRRLAIHLPEELQTATHVFVQRGGVQTSLATPYVGPYRVVERQQHFYKIAIPGGTTEKVSIARIRPAIMPDEEEGEPPASPPTPPRPGRRPRPPINPPSPTAIRTRSSGVPTADDPGEGTSAQAQAPLDPISSDDEEDFFRHWQRTRKSVNWGDESDDQSDQSPPTPAPADPDPAEQNNDQASREENQQDDPNPTPRPTRRFTTNRQRTFSNRGGPIPRQLFDNQQQPNPPRTFSKPKPGDFSYKRRRPDVNAFFNIVADHLEM